MAEGMLYYTFTVNSMIREYHIYKDIWENPTIGEELCCKQEVGNPKDPQAVAVINLLREKTPLLAVPP